MSKKLTFKEIEERGLLLYRYIRGSHCQGTATETSDVDEGGVFICPPEQLLDLGFDYQDQVANESNDIVWYEFNKYIRLLLSANPTMLESLFVDDEFVIYEHPIMTELKKHKQEFISKQCFKSFIGYSYEQIKKARGLNKKIVQPIVEKKGILSYCYTFHKQGSSKITNWLEYRGLDQRYCGLVNVANMHQMYSVFYDWGNFFKEKNISANDLVKALNDTNEYDTIRIVKDLKQAKADNNPDLIEQLENKLKKAQFQNMVLFICEKYDIDTNNTLECWYNKQTPIGYRGIVSSEKESQDVRLSSVEKGSSPICYMSYNKDGYIKGCKDYKEYIDWVEHRNPERFRMNTAHGKNYDSKNLSHSVRLLHTGLEIAKEGKYIVNRKNIDRDLLLEIKRGEKNYDELMEYIESKKTEMEEAMKNSTIPDTIDVDKINELVLNVRKQQLLNLISNEQNKD